MLLSRRSVIPAVQQQRVQQPAMGKAPIGNRLDSTELKPTMRNTLFYGDNLNVLRGQVADESVDLIYLDPPFNCLNSDYADYGITQRTADGQSAESA